MCFLFLLIMVMIFIIFGEFPFHKLGYRLQQSNNYLTWPNLVQILRYLFQMFVQNGSKPSVSNWWKQCQRLTRLCSTVRGITQQSSTHADGPIYICTCPYHCFYGLLLFTCLSLGSQSRWCGNEDRYAVYTDSEGVEFTPRT